MKNVGIIGAGAMGSGIAQVAATAGHSVVLFDTNAEALSLSKSKLASVMGRLVENGRLTSEEAQEIQKRISYADHMEALSESGIIIEAIIENLDVKKGVFSSIESMVSKDCILASNTSSLSITSIASACERSESRYRNSLL